MGKERDVEATLFLSVSFGPEIEIVSLGIRHVRDPVLFLHLNHSPKQEDWARVAWRVWAHGAVVKSKNVLHPHVSWPRQVDFRFSEVGVYSKHIINPEVDESLDGTA